MYAGEWAMHKLMILIDSLDDWTTFDENWPQFLHQAEDMPGLRREVTSRVDSVLYGEGRYAVIHELYFDSLGAAQEAMSSKPGREAGRILQAITDGQMTLLFADHKEDEIENIRKFKNANDDDDDEPGANSD
jgi:uncharacterized protein (TIGR02118 family)